MENDSMHCPSHWQGDRRGLADGRREDLAGPVMTCPACRTAARSLHENEGRQHETDGDDGHPLCDAEIVKHGPDRQAVIVHGYAPRGAAPTPVCLLMGQCRRSVRSAWNRSGAARKT